MRRHCCGTSVGATSRSKLLDEDEYVIEVAYGSGPHTYSREQVAGEKVDFDAFKVSRRCEAA